jgi:GT2 family glycosyltransferase
VETTEGWAEVLVCALTEDNYIAAVMPKVLSYTDRTKFEYAGAAGGFIDIFGYPFCRGRILSTIEEDKNQYDNYRSVFWATGACIAVHSDIFRSVGGFDERFFAHMEEIDLCWRMQLLGLSDIKVEPQSVIYHLGGGTLSANNPRKTYLNFRNTLLMLYKNLPKNKLWILSVRMLLDGGSALVYLLQGKKELFNAVREAHRDFRKMRREMRAKCNARRPEYLPYGIYKGSILLRYLFGKKTFGKLM